MQTYPLNSKILRITFPKVSETALPGSKKPTFTETEQNIKSGTFYPFVELGPTYFEFVSMFWGAKTAIFLKNRSFFQPKYAQILRFFAEMRNREKSETFLPFVEQEPILRKMTNETERDLVYNRESAFIWR